MTSHDVVSVIRRIYGVKRVGHAGTLDPAAAGVLPIFIGNSTRLIEYLAESDKTYRAQVTFGYETDTGDDTGQVTNKIDWFTMPEREVIEQTLSFFSGTIEQTPPMYSALKVNGKKLYEFARAGLTVDRKPRKITIHSLRLLDINSRGILIETTCSKGTYIRTLCQDIGLRLGIFATMSFLVRTEVGIFNLSESLTLEEIESDKHKALLRADNFLNLPVISLYNKQLQCFKNGQRISRDYWDADNLPGEIPGETSLIVKVYDISENFIGIGRISKIPGRQELLTPVKVMPLSAQTDGDK